MKLMNQKETAALQIENNEEEKKYYIYTCSTYTFKQL